MGLIFADAATPKQKAWTLVLYACLALFFLGIFSDIIVDEQLAVGLGWLAGGLSVLGVIWAMYAIYKKDSAIRQRVATQKRRLWVVSLGALIGIPIILYGTLVKGVPAGLHYLVAEEGDMVVEVDHRAHSYSSKHCSGGVFVKGHDSFMNDEVCGLQEKDWASVEAGDRLQLFGRKSSFSFTYDRYLILK